MTTKTFRQRIVVEKLAIDVDDPFDFHLEKFKSLAREIFYEIEEISWRPILDKGKKIVWIEFIAHGIMDPQPTQ